MLHRRLWMLVFCVSLGGLGPSTTKASSSKGRIFGGLVAGGSYWAYEPSKLDEGKGLLVIVHGSLARHDRASDTALRFLRRWIGLSEREGLVLLAPIFDRARYQEGYGGYRGLFGRDMGADTFLHTLVSAMRARYRGLPRTFRLYGHSAGGQFVIRYSLRHPQRLLACVASAPGRFAFPTTDAAWPYGMAPLRRSIRYKTGLRREVDVRPDPQDWLLERFPLTILVGERDREIQPRRPAHPHADRVELAKAWVQAMEAFAKQRGRRTSVRLAIIPGIRHNSAKLTPYAIRVFFPLFSKKKASHATP